MNLDFTKPLIMGILNVTPDSFSDGGKFYSRDAAVGHALKMAADGADIIDIGGESSRPGSDPISLDEELRRTIPIIEIIRSKSKIPISIDTTKSKVAKNAIEAGANIINDISAGAFDEEMFPLAAKKQCPICLMHIKGNPKNMQISPCYNNLINDICEYFKDRIEVALSNGIKRSNILIDPGIGFGKSVEDNLEIIKHLDIFKQFGLPILIGTSRKSFIGKALNLDLDQRLEPTLATLAVCYNKGANIFRVHDVAEARRFMDMCCLLA